MSRCRAQVILYHDTGLPEDVTVNVFHFEPSSSVAAAAAGIALGLENFYTTVNTGQTDSIADFLSPELSGDVDIKFYDLNESEPRVPVAIESFSFSPPGLAPLPSEVAVCASFQGQRISGVSQARRRGRVYLGPLNADASVAVSNRARPAADFRAVIVAAMERLHDDSDTNEHNWSIYSQVNNNLVPVADGWVDNAFDTQRRRGARSSIRDTWPV